MKTFIKKHRTLLIVGSFLLGLCIGFVKYFGLKAPLASLSEYDALSKDTPFSVEMKRFGEAFGGPKGGAAGTHPALAAFAGKFPREGRCLDSIIRTTGDAGAKLLWGRSVAAPSVIRANDFGWLFVFAPKDWNEEKYERFIKSLVPQKKKFTTYRGQTVADLTFSKEVRYTFAYYKGVMLASAYPLLTEYGLGQLASPSKGFPELDTQLDDGPFSVRVNWPMVPEFMRILAENGHQDLQSLADWASVSDVSLSMDKEGLLAKGSLQPSSGQWDALVAQGLGEASRIGEILPDNTAVLHYFGGEDITDVAAHSQKDFSSYIKKWWTREAAYVITEPAGMDYTAEKLVILGVEDTVKASELLEKAAFKLGSEPLVRHTNHVIRRILSRDMLTPVFGNSLKTVSNPYYAVLDKHIVFANSLSTLKLFLDKFNFGQTLNGLPQFQSVMKTLPMRANYYFWINPSLAFPIAQSYTKKTSAEDLRLLWSRLEALGPLAIKMVGTGKRMNVETRISTSTASQLTKGTVAWRADLKDVAVMPPSLVKNHENGRWEVIIQDKGNRLYLIATDGKVLWERTLESAVLSEVFQVDYFKNGQLQYVFNTNEKLYLIDRNGQDVLKPLNIPAKAQVGLSLNNAPDGERLLMGCDNGLIYGFGIDGTPLAGWSPLPGVGKLYFPTVHARMGKREYTLGLSKNNKLFAWDRGGKSFFPAVQLDGGFLSPPAIDSLAGRIAVADKSGTIHIINAQGMSFKLKQPTGPGTNTRFVYADLVGDKRLDYVLMSGKDVSCSYYDKNNQFVKAFATTLPEWQNDLFKVKLPGRGRECLGLLNAQSKKIYLLDENGKLHPGFPLVGNTRFRVNDFFGDGRTGLAVAMDNVVYLYRID